MTDVVTIATTISTLASTITETTTVDVGYSLPGSGTLASSGGTMLGTLILDGAPPVQIPSGAAAGDVLVSDISGNASWSAAPSSLDARYVNVAGDTMTGQMVLDSGSPAIKIPTGAGAGYVLTSDGSGNGTWAATAGQPELVPTAVKTANYTANPSDFVPVSVAAGSFTITLPTAPANGTTIGVKIVGTNSTATNTLTVKTGGSDVFNVASGSTSSTLMLQYQGEVYQYQTSTAIWYRVDNDLPLSGLKNLFPDWVNVKAYGATGNGQRVNDAAITGGTSTVTSSSATFTAADVGKLVLIQPQFGTLTTGYPLATTITAYNSAHSVTISATPANSAASALMYWGTDDSGAIQAAINAAKIFPHFNALGMIDMAQVVYFPYAIYMISTALTNQTSLPFNFVGGGATICAPESGVFLFGDITTNVTGMARITGLTLDGAGGHLISDVNLRGYFFIDHCELVQRSPSYSIYYRDDIAQSGQTTLYSAKFSELTYWLGPGTRSYPAFMLQTETGAQYTDICFEYINGPNPPGATYANIDNTQYQFLVSVDDSSGSFEGVSNIVFRNILAANFYGGLINIMAANHALIENINVFNTYSETVTNPLFYFTTAPDGSSCHNVEMRNINRNNGLGSGSPPPPYDVAFDTGTHSYVLIQNYSASNGTGPWINLNGTGGATLINNGGPSSAAIISGTSSDTIVINSGIVSAASASANNAAALTPTFANGTAGRLSDLTRDYMIYMQVGTPGTAFSLLIGPTSTPANTVFASATPTAGDSLSFRLPAGWYVKWAGTSTTMANQLAIGC